MRGASSELLPGPCDGLASQVVRCLLNCGADGNVCGGVKDRPLHLAASRGLSAIATLLLDAGADRKSFK